MEHDYKAARDDFMENYCEGNPDTDNAIEHALLLAEKVTGAVKGDSDYMGYADIVTDDEIRAVWGNADFGWERRREIILDTLLKWNADFSTGNTATHICADLGLLNGYRKRGNITLSKKGRRYLYYAVKPFKATIAQAIEELKQGEG